MTNRNSWEGTLGDVLSPGDVIAGKFRVERVIGRGGMGVVVQAWHLDFDEPVAMKFLLPSVGSNDEARSRFEREARAAFKIKGEHVARVIDVGKTDGGLPFLVMEYLEGQDLADILAAKRVLPIGDAVDLVLQACDAVAEAHAQGIVHRDLKPENLFVTQRPDGTASVKVLDFGLSKVKGASRERALTTVDQLMGTPHYMSPEQWVSAHDVGPSADLWALAVILYELITGQPPFRGEKLSDICNQVLQAEPPPMALYRAEVPMALEAVLRACLQKQPVRRLANVGEFAVRLHSFANREGRLAAKRASGVLRTAGIPVDGSIPTLTLEAIKMPDGVPDDELEELPTANFSADPTVAEQIRLAHEFLAKVDEGKTNGAQPRPSALGPEEGHVHDERTGAATLLLPDSEPPPPRPVEPPPLAVTPPGADPPSHPPTRTPPQPAQASVVIAPRVEPRAASEEVLVGPSPWVAVSAPPGGTPGPAPLRVGGSHQPPRGNDADVSATRVDRSRRDARIPAWRLLPRQWLGLVIGLAIAAAGLALLLVAHATRGPAAESEPTPGGADSTASAATIEDPVPALTAVSPPAPASSTTGASPAARANERARAWPTVVGSRPASVPSSPKIDGVPKAKRKLPTGFE